MASQSQRGGGTWSGYMRQLPFRVGWQSVQNNEPFCDDIARRLWNHPDETGAIQRMYEAGRLMALETRMPLPAKAARVTKEIAAAVKAAPAMCRQFATEQALARAEAKRAAALRLKLMHYERQKAA